MEAIRWADRACRLLPSDDTLALALASACLGQDDAKAAALFAPLAARYDMREAWIGLAIAYRNLGDYRHASTAVHKLLARHVPDDSVAALADTIARQFGLPGWCGVTLDGDLRVELIGGSQRVELEIDGARQPPRKGGCFRLPAARWMRARQIAVTDAGSHLLGSPIDAARIKRVEGCVTTRDGTIEGWAWHPAAPAADPVITILAASGQQRRFTAHEPTSVDPPVRPLGQPRRIFLSRDDLSAFDGPVRLRGRDGRDLLGSPLDPGAERRAAVQATLHIRATSPLALHGTGRSKPILPLSVPADITGPSPPLGADRRRRVADVVIPVHDGGATTRACLESVLATVTRPSRVIVVDDATSEPELSAYLGTLAHQRRIHLIRHAQSLGYPASANAGMRACAKRDVVLLNSDTLVPPGWLERLREVAYSAADIGTVSPLSNNATVLSYPRRDDGNPMPDDAATARIAALAWRANGAAAIDVPVTVGFCMYLRRDCLSAVGALREDIFAQGYGEENDYCLRARHLGWRHMAAPGVFVAHRGAQSFGTEGEALRSRNQGLLNRMYPGYAELILAHYRNDPLVSARLRLDQVRWNASADAKRPATLLITHDAGGGVEQRIAAACAAQIAAGRRPVVLRPASARDGITYLRLADGMRDDYPNLRFAMPVELTALIRFLKRLRPAEVQLHHTLGHHTAIYDLIARLDVPYDVHVHDYLLICPRVTLVGRERRYCGEPILTTCEHCMADLGSYAGDTVSVGRLRQRSEELLARARGIVTPSHDAAARIRRYFPALRPEVVPHEDDAVLAATPLHAAVSGSIARICVVGAIGVDKGFEVLLACARDATERGLPLEFVVVGHTIDDGRLLDTGSVFITGEYRRDEAVPLIQAQNASLAWVPSIWPETWCFTLSEAWRAGLRVATFDLGAQAERVRRTGRGIVLPLGLPAASINSALLSAVGLSGHP